MSTSARKPNYTLPIIVMFFLFAMISFVTGFQNPFGVILKAQLGLSNFQSQLGAAANFIAYAIMGIPAGMLLQKRGYKFSAISAVLVGLLGVAIMFASSYLEEKNTIFVVYITGALVAGFSMCMLNTVVNPMLNTLGGGGNKGNQLIQTGGALNSLSGTLTPFFVGALIGQLTSTTSMGSVAPLLWIAMGVFAFAFVVISFVAIPEPNLVKKGQAKIKYEHSPWSFRHTVLGVVGIFIYVGIEIGIPGTLNFYLSDQTASGAGVIGDASTIAGAIVAVYWFLMLVGRTLSSAISGKVSSRTQLIAVSGMGILLVLAAIFTSKDSLIGVPGFIYTGASGELASVPMSAFFLVLCGLCTSVMWGGIFNLAVEGLGKYTAQASGIFMMMVVGGGVIPLIQQLFAGSVGYMPSYWLIVACLGYLFIYGIWGCINVNKDIPVSLEDVMEEELV